MLYVGLPVPAWTGDRVPMQARSPSPTASRAVGLRRLDSRAWPYRHWRAWCLVPCWCWLRTTRSACLRPPPPAHDGPAIANETPESSHVEPGPQPIDKGDHAWMLVSSALVLMMTRRAWRCSIAAWCKKNVLSVMMQCVFLMCLMSVIWAVGVIRWPSVAPRQRDVQPVDRQRRFPVHAQRAAV